MWEDGVDDVEERLKIEFLQVEGPLTKKKATYRGKHVKTLPETNIAGWKINHFDGIYEGTWGFSWAMLVSGRVSDWLGFASCGCVRVKEDDERAGCLLVLGGS